MSKPAWESALVEMFLPWMSPTESETPYCAGLVSELQLLVCRDSRQMAIAPQSCFRDCFLVLAFVSTAVVVVVVPIAVAVVVAAAVFALAVLVLL